MQLTGRKGSGTSYLPIQGGPIMRKLFVAAGLLALPFTALAADTSSQDSIPLELPAEPPAILKKDSAFKFEAEAQCSGTSANSQRMNGELTNCLSGSTSRSEADQRSQ
jgi:hypothetical protein